VRTAPDKLLATFALLLTLIVLSAITGLALAPAS
jgi:hypothetical protein